MKIIPQQADKKYSHPNTGDFFGNIKQTKNITFVKNGYIGLEKRTRNIFDSATYTDLRTYTTEPITCICAGGQMGSLDRKNIWIAGTKSLYYFDNNDFTLKKDAVSGTPSGSAFGYDMVVFDTGGYTNYLMVCDGNYLYQRTITGAAAWSTITTGFGGYSEGIKLFENLASIAVWDIYSSAGQHVQLIDTTFSLGQKLTLPAGYDITCMAWNNNRMYIGTSNMEGKEAMVFEWDGIGVEANYGHKVRGQTVYSIAKYKTGVAFVTNMGQLMYLESSVSELANFPIYYNNKQWDFEGGFPFWNFKSWRNAITVDKDMIFIGIDASYYNQGGDTTADTFENDFASGVWCYDPEVGLHHRYSIDGSPRVQTGAITTDNVNTTTNIITIPSSVCPDTGTPVFYNDGSNGSGTKISPLVFDKKYYVIKLSSTTLKLATTYADALAGTAIDLTTTGNNAQTLSFHPNDGFGGTNNPVKTLSLIKTESFGLPQYSFATKLLIGGNIIKTTVGTYTATINSVEWKQENRGYFLTPRLLAEKVTDTFQKIICKYIPLKTVEDKIIFKYRKVATHLDGTKLSTLSPTGTWVTSNTFTVTDVSNMALGNEIEITNGGGAGYLAHITNISAPVAGVYTITIDETVQNVTAGWTFQFTVDNWVKIPTIITTSYMYNKDGYAEIQIPEGGRATAIELKVELRGEDVTIEELQIISAVQQ